MLPPIHRWDLVAQPRASVHIVHGMAEHAARYARFARALNDGGFNVWAHDGRGHGTKPGTRDSRALCRLERLDGGARRPAGGVAGDGADVSGRTARPVRT